MRLDVRASLACDDAYGYADADVAVAIAFIVKMSAIAVGSKKARRRFARPGCGGRLSERASRNVS